jgi:2-(1,2-epoxy-1,2-dihydrophenyl)acetyl-CoA isomerase
LSGLVLLERDGPIATMTLNRAERHNSLVPVLLEELLAALSAIADDRHIRAAILQANGRSFSTGGDLQGFVDHLYRLEDYAHGLVGRLNRTILALIDLPVPVVAVVQGAVSGGSLGLALACDLILLAPEATFTPYYGMVGFSPDGGWTTLLPAQIGPRAAGEVLLTNRTITAEEALAAGMANRVVPAKALRETARDIAGGIAAMAPGSVRRTKRLRWADREDLAAHLEVERAHFVDQIASEEARERMLAFLETMRGREG